MAADLTSVAYLHDKTVANCADFSLHQRLMPMTSSLCKHNIPVGTRFCASADTQKGVPTTVIFADDVTDTNR